jgi:hypothetical protein
VQRRTWLKSVTGALAGHFLLGNVRAQSGPAIRNFKVLPPDEGGHPATQLQDAFAYDGNVYYLAHEAGESGNEIYKVGCTSPAGKMVWRRRLPYGLYNGIGMSPKGSLLLLAIPAPGRHKDDPLNSVYSVAPGEGNPPQLTWVAAIPSTQIGIGILPFLKGSHFGLVTNGLSLSMTTLNDALRPSPPANYNLPAPPYRAFDILPHGTSVLVVNKETAEVGVCDSASAAYSPIAISGSAVSVAKAALQKSIQASTLGPNATELLIAASGVVGDSLHMLLLPFLNGVATYAWCDANFAVKGAMNIPLSQLPRAVSLGILQLGGEAAIVYSDGSAVAFPIPA